MDLQEDLIVIEIEETAETETARGVTGGGTRRGRAAARGLGQGPGLRIGSEGTGIGIARTGIGETEIRGAGV